MKRKVVKLSVRTLLRKAGYSVKDILRVWYIGEDLQHGISFENKEVLLEITLMTKSKRGE